MEKPTSLLLGLGSALAIGICLGVLGHSLYSSPTVEVVGTESLEGTERETPAPVEAEDRASGGDKALDVSVPPASHRTVVAPVIHPLLGVVVYGVVSDGQGHPLESASVGFTSSTPGQKGIYVTTRNGGYSTHGLKAGLWKILVRGEGLEDTRSEVEIAAEPFVRLDLVAPRAYLVTVRVQTPDGKAMRGALNTPKLHRIALNAIVTKTQPQTVPMTTLRYHSRFGIGKWSGSDFHSRRKDMSDDADVLGLLELSEPPPAYVSLMLKHNILATQKIMPGQKELTFVLTKAQIVAKTATISLRVIDEVTRQPIAKARVSISDQQSGGGGLATQPDGTLVLSHQATGLMEINISAAGHEYYHARLRLSPGDVDLGTIALGPRVKAEGIVVDSAGKPQRASVTWTNLDRQSFPQPLVSGRSGGTDNQGKFALWGVGRGRYLVQARIRGKSLATKIVDTGKLSSEPFRLVLEASYPIAVDNTKMSAMRSLTLLIRDSQRRLVYGRFLTGPYLYKTRLPVGTYTFEVFEDLKRLRGGNVTVGVGKGATILIQG